MFHRLTHNLTIKILCLTSSAFLWVYVAAGQNTVAKFPSSLTIKTMNIPAGLTAVYDTKVLEIKIMAEPSIWRKLSADSFSAFVDLSQASAGTIETPVNVISSVPGVQIVEKTPASILISLEPVVSKEVEINKKIEGSVGEGLAPGNISLEPEKVTIKGAKSLIDNIGEATAIIFLNGESESFKKSISVLAEDERGEAIKNIEFSPSEVTAQVAVVRASNNKTVGIKVKTSGTAKSGYYIAGITVEPSVVDVIGPKAILDTVNYLETYSIDLAGASEEISREVNLNVADGLALQSGVSPKVRIKITFAEVPITRQFVVAVGADNVDGSLKIVSISPAEVSVLLSGGVDALGSIKSADIIGAIDLKGKSAGIYSFNLSADNFKVPAAAVFSSALPSSVSITLEKK